MKMDANIFSFCLFQDGVSIDTRPVPKHISSLDFLDLIPGQAYRVSIQSQSGTLTNSNTASGRAGNAAVELFVTMNNHLGFSFSLLVFTPAAPAAVTALQADNGHTTHSLTVSWERPVGAFDGYRLQLLDEAGGVVRNRSVAGDSQSEQLEGLTSGKRYRVKLVTLSGGVTSLEAAAAEGQTRESFSFFKEAVSRKICFVFIMV